MKKKLAGVRLSAVHSKTNQKQIQVSTVAILKADPERS